MTDDWVSSAIANIFRPAAPQPNGAIGEETLARRARRAKMKTARKPEKAKRKRSQERPRSR